MRKLFTLLTLVLSISCSTTKKTSPVTTTTENKDYLEGIITTENLKQVPYKEWYSENYNEYTVDENTLSQLTAIPNWKQNTQAIIYMGTWCDDSQLQVPHLVKIFEKLNFNSFTIIAMDKNKKTATGLEDGRDISRVPTVIFIQNRNEINRIVESPKETLEKDIVKILFKDNYKPRTFN